MPTISNLAAVVSAIAAMVSAIAAIRSAASARQAHLESEANEKRTRILSLLALSFEFEQEREHLIRSTEKLVLARSSLFAFYGNLGREQKDTKKTEAELKDILERNESARLKEKNSEPYLNSSDDDILKAEAKLRRALVETRGFREQMEVDQKEAEQLLEEARAKPL